MDVLIIDDDQNIHRILSRVVTRMGHEASTASNGQEGLQFLETTPTDLIFLDIYMPGMSGLTVLRHLKSNQDTQNIPVVVMTAFYNNENIANVIGAYEIFSKSNIVTDAARVIEEIAGKVPE